MLDEKLKLLFAELRKPKRERNDLQFVALYVEVVALVDAAEDIDFAAFATLTPEERKAFVQMFLLGFSILPA
jgi:DNA-directed RNA polymerase specialized sigma24 family protein